MIKSEKILKVTLEQYLESVGKEITDYDLIGIHANGHTRNFVRCIFQNKAPSETEVVVDYRIEGLEYGHADAYGTALIPKKNECESCRGRFWKEKKNKPTS